MVSGRGGYAERRSNRQNVSRLATPPCALGYSPGLLPVGYEIRRPSLQYAHRTRTRLGPLGRRLEAWLQIVVPEGAQGLLLFLRHWHKPFAALWTRRARPRQSRLVRCILHKRRATCTENTRSPRTDRDASNMPNTLAFVLGVPRYQPRESKRMSSDGFNTRGVPCARRYGILGFCSAAALQQGNLQGMALRTYGSDTLNGAYSFHPSCSLT